MVDVGAWTFEPRPGPLSFPFEAAEKARVALEAHMEDWKTCRRIHLDAADSARKDFEGRTRDEFDQEFEHEMNDIQQTMGRLQNDTDALDKLIQQAKAGIDARNDEIGEWEWRRNAYEEAVGHP